MNDRLCVRMATCGLLAAAVACIASVAAAGPFGLKLFGKKEAQPDYAAAPDFSKSFADYERDNERFAERGRTLGYKPLPEQGRLARMTSKVTESKLVRGVRDAVSRGAHRATDLVAPVEGDVSDPTSLAKKIDKLEPNLFVAAARVQEQAGEAESAARQYEQALAIDPNYYDALLGYARLCETTQQPERAIALYQQATQAHPDRPAAFNDLGLALARAGQFDQALGALGQAVQLQPDRPLYRNNLATILVEVGRPDDALAQLMSVHEPAIAHYNVGYLLNQKGDARAAAHHFGEALALNPAFDEARRWIELLTAPGGQLGMQANAAAPGRFGFATPANDSMRMAGRRSEQPPPALPGPSSAGTASQGGEPLYKWSQRQWEAAQQRQQPGNGSDTIYAR